MRLRANSRAAFTTESWPLGLLIHVFFPLSQQSFERNDEVRVLSGEIVALARIVVQIE
jgi:hypothetical protein